MFLQLNIIDVETRRRRIQIHTPNRVEGIGLYALTFTAMSQNNFCNVIFPLELNTGSIPFPIAMLVLSVRYLLFRFNIPVRLSFLQLYDVYVILKVISNL